MLWRQAVAEQHVQVAESLEQLLTAVWREIARWKDAEKRAIAAQVTVDPATLDSLDKMYVFTDIHSLKKLIHELNCNGNLSSYRSCCIGSSLWKGS